MTKPATLSEILEQARTLSPLDKVRLIEQIAPDIERELAARSTESLRSLLGLCKDLGSAPSASEIDEARREAWALFPRED